MGKGRDLTTTERAMVHSKIKLFWDYENKKIKHDKVFKIEDKWACYYNNLRSIMSCLGGNDYK